MLYSLAVILIIIWLVAQVTAYTLGGLIHLLLVFALVSIVIRLIQGRQVL